MNRSTRWLAAASLTLALVGTACSSNDDKKTTATAAPSTPAATASVAASSAATAARTASPAAAASGTAAAGATALTKAADLRTALTGLLSEHEALASAATAAALGGRSAEFDAAAAALDTNSVDISRAIGSVYGAQAEQAFLPLWRKHIGFFVDYTQATAAKDQTKKDKATTDLNGYTQDAAAFFNSANPALSKDAVAGLLKEHVAGLSATIDAQASGDPVKAYAAERQAYAHMSMIAGALSDAIAKQFPDKFPGAATSAASTLRSNLNLLEREHVFLASRATGAALGGRSDEFTAAANALDANSVELSRAIGAAYGSDAEAAFLPLWRKHIGFFVDYTQATAAKDQTKKDTAVTNLVGYTQDFAAFVNSANGLPKDTVAGLLKDHVTGLATVVDDQGAGNQPKAYTDLRMAMGHMQMIADPFAEATVKKFPAKFA